MFKLQIEHFVWIAFSATTFISSNALAQSQVGPAFQRAAVVEDYVLPDHTGLKPPVFYEPWDIMNGIRRAEFGADLLSPRTFLPLFDPRPMETQIDFNMVDNPFGFTPLDPIFQGPLEVPMRPIRALEHLLYEQCSTMSNIYYTLVLQSLSRTLPGEGNLAGVGRLDANFLTVLAKTPGLGTSAVQILFRQHNVIGQPSNWTPGGASGSYFFMDSLQNENNSTLNIVSFQQGLLDDRVVLSVGKMHPNHFFMLNFYANDESRQFLNGSFDGNSVFQPAQGTYSPGFVAQMIPCDDIYVNAAIFDLADYPGDSFQNINAGLYWAGVEVGWTPNWLGAFSRYNVTFGTTNAGNQSYSGYGDVTGIKQSNSMIGFLGQQQIGDWLGVFAEYGLGDSTGAVAQQELSVGVSIVRPFGRPDDDFGIAFAWTKPNNNYGNEIPGSEPQSASVLETFYRLQLTNSLQLSPDLQVSFDPASGDGSPVVALGLRLKMQF